MEAAGRPEAGKSPGEGEVLAISEAPGELVRYRPYTPASDAEGTSKPSPCRLGKALGWSGNVSWPQRYCRRSMPSNSAILARLGTAPA